MPDISRIRIATRESALALVQSEWVAAQLRAFSPPSTLSRLGMTTPGDQILDKPLAQISGIARRVPQTELLELPDCGHSPHRDQPERLITSITAFIERQTHGDKP